MRSRCAVFALLVGAAGPAATQEPVDTTLTIQGFLQRDNEVRVSFPAVATTARSISPDNFVFTSDQLPRPETRFQGANRGSFQDAEVAMAGANAAK